MSISNAGSFFLEIFTETSERVQCFRNVASRDFTVNFLRKSTYFPLKPPLKSTNYNPRM